MESTVHGTTHARALAHALCESALDVGQWVLADGREAQVVELGRTGLGSIAVRVRFSGTETKWLSPLRIQKLN